jgi:AcrR family transcriptional regulator
MRLTASHELTKTGEAIIASSIELFGTLGYHATSVRDIASSVGIRPGALYNHFAGKQDILFYIIDQGQTALYNYVQGEVSQRNTPQAQLRAFVTHHVAFHANNQEQTLVIDRELAALSPRNRRIAVRKRRQYEELLEAILKEGMSAGAFNDVDSRLATYAIIGMGAEVAAWFNPEGRLALEEIERIYASLALAMLVCFTRCDGQG